MHTSKTIGERIASLRSLRDLTQDQLADRACVSVDTIRKLEQNARLSARIDTLRKLARALDIELDRLLGQPTVTRDVPADGGMLALRNAIQDVDALPGVPGSDLDEDPPEPDAWLDSVRVATSLYWRGEYSELSGMLPLVLRDGRAVAGEVTAPDAERVWQQLALVYQLAASLAAQAGHVDWAYLAVSKQLEAAQHASDPLMEGMGVSTLSWVLLRQGRWEQAQEAAERKADALEPSMRHGTDAQFAVYGSLLLTAAVPAARQDRTDEADEYLNLAAAAATRSGSVRVYGTAFSPVDVATQTVQAALAGSDPNPSEALRLAARIDLSAISRPVHRARHRLDVAQAQYRHGNNDGALSILLEVEAEQPEWIRFQTLAQATVGEMWEAERRKNSALRGLASRLGVEPHM